MRNVEEKLPEKQRPSAHAAMTAIMHAELEPEARRKLETLAKSYEHKYPKVASCLRDDSDRLFAYYRFSARDLGAFTHYQRYRVDFCTYSDSYGCDEAASHCRIRYRRNARVDNEVSAIMAKITWLSRVARFTARTHCIEESSMRQ